MSLKSHFDTYGYVLCEGVLGASFRARIQDSMLAIMQPYCEDGPVDEDPQAAIDRCFSYIASLGPEEKSTIYTMFGRIHELPLLLDQPGIRDVVKQLGFSKFTIQAYSVFCLEPGNTRHKFLPHQDLRNRTSLKSLLVWVPLSSGQALGGMACWPGSHKSGPIRHELSAGGQLMLAADEYARYKRRDLTGYSPGDVIFMDPYLIHESVENTGDAIRWTAVLKIDDIDSNKHLLIDLHPFPIDQFIDSRPNAERLTTSR